MSDIAEKLWEAIEPLVFIGRDAFMGELAGWDLEKIEIAGKGSFVVLTKGPEFHFVSQGGTVPISVKMIRDRLRPIMDRYGFVRTRTPKDDERQNRFNRLIGFRVDGEDEFFYHYRLDAFRRGGEA